MTEEQKKKCEEIYNSCNFDFRFLLMKKDEFIKITISLAKVFNRDITEKEAEKIININKVIFGSANPINNDIDTFWNIVNYFEEQQKRCEEIINSSEEKYKKSLEELLDNFHEGYVPSALLFHYGNMDTIFYYYNPISMLFGGMVPLSFILSQMEGVENEFFEFLGDSKDKTAEIIIDATVSLSEIFNKNITKEEAEKLLFIKNDTKEEKFGTAYLGKFCVFTEEFRKIIEEYEEDKYGIERVISAIANYFDNGNKEANKINKINKINNVVETTAKEKTMTKEEQKKKCKDIINSYKTKLEGFNIRLLMMPFSSILNPMYKVKVESIASMTISLAKVFNKEITENEAEKIIRDLIMDLKENPDDEKYKDFESMCWAIVDKLDDEITLNLLILGQTGVGKSSLLNYLAGKPLFITADNKEGREKVTPNTPYGIFLETVEIDAKKVNVYDSWGLERDKAPEWKELIEKELEERSVDKDIKHWFHSVTFCISAGKNGIEHFEIDTIKKFLNEKYNVIIALTQADYILSESKEENDKFIEMIKEKSGANIVIPIATNPKKSMIMTETPKPFGIEEYKAAILISWEKIFIDRMPLHIIEKLKKDIEKAKNNAPNRKPKDDDDLKILAKEIDEYFINIINKKLPIHIKENFEKYNKITENGQYNKSIKWSDD